MNLISRSDSKYLTWKSKFLERHMNDIFFTSCENLFIVMKFKFEAIYGYEIMPEIEI